MVMINFQSKQREQIKSVINCPEATVRFLVGGTQTNQVVINSVLEPYEGVISNDTGHVVSITRAVLLNLVVIKF